MTEPLGWLVDYFERNGETNGRSVHDLLDENYVTMELLDSLGIVEMLGGIEEDFGVWLEPEDMQDPSFCTIRGLAALVDRARKKA